MEKQDGVSFELREDKAAKRIKIKIIKWKIKTSIIHWSISYVYTGVMYVFKVFYIDLEM